MIQELTDEGRVEILETQCRRRCGEPLGGVAQQQTEGVTVAGEGVLPGAPLPT
jgi:hypothetical protein